jgi:putative toxin-antitoxin system antitoxin component (TIGR02293 family)
MEADNWRMTVAAIAMVLGGRKTLKREMKTESDLRVATRDGLPVGTLPVLAGKLGVERKRLAQVVGISDRTLSRRIAANAKLTLEESDRTMRLARVFAIAEDTLGATEKAARWMQRPNLALGNATPLELLDTDMGAREVEEVLMRIEYGMFS